MSKVLVTGACGGIGSKLIPQLLREGYEVIAVDNLYSGSWENLENHKKLKKFTIDITDTSQTENELSKIDFESCIHLAAISSLPECQVNPKRAMEVNFLATVSIVELCARKSNFRSFIFSSTSALYEGLKSEILVEGMLVSPILVYPQSKFFAELYLQSAFKTRGFPGITTRLFNVFGENQNALRKSPPLINYLVREMSMGRSPRLFGWNAPARDYIYVDHVVTYISKLLISDKAFGKTYNICTGSGLTVRQIYQFVSNALECDIQPILDDPENLWSSYGELYEALYPLKHMYIQAETNKLSLGSPIAIRELLGNYIQFDHESEIMMMALNIRDNLMGLNE